MAFNAKTRYGALMEYIRAPRAKYTMVGEAIRNIIPENMQCSIGCGGQACKYDNPSYWSDEQQAIKGLHSSWVTDHLLAMSRPSTEIIEKYNIIDQFKRNGIKTVINLQIPGEHAHCGNPLEPESGFSYHPEVFMENNIYFYNYGWSDYGVGNLTTILDAVKVMGFALQEGKTAVHCHAGLGRTEGLSVKCNMPTSPCPASIAIHSKPGKPVTSGKLSSLSDILIPDLNIQSNILSVYSDMQCIHSLFQPGVLLACFLAYTTRMTANQAILYVRAKRPDSIQTRSQLRCVRQFVQFLTPLRNVFSCAEPRTKTVTLSQYLNRQRHILHGYERRELSHLPKIVQLVSRLLVDIAENREVIEEDILEAPDIQDIEMTLSIIEKMGPELFTQEPRLPGTPTLPRHFNEPPIFYHRKSLSYSESDLRRLSSQLNLLTQSLSSLPQSNAQVSHCETIRPDFQPQVWSRNTSVTSHNSTGSLWEIKNAELQKNASILLKDTQMKPIQRSESVGNSDAAKKGNMLSRWKAEQREELAMNGKMPHGREDEQSEVPFITLQSELSLEARRLLVAQALAVDLFCDGKEEHKRKVLIWQEELNQGGAWERLCLERDPFILTGLMWAWLEQLKEPVISIQDAMTLSPDNTDAQTVLNTLDQAPKETLTCILDCMAHMMKIPVEVEDAFLNRTIKAFTWKKNKSEDGRKVYETMTTVLRCVLNDIRTTALKEDQKLNTILFPLT